MALAILTQGTRIKTIRQVSITNRLIVLIRALIRVLIF